MLQRIWRHLVAEGERGLRADYLVHFMARALQPEEAEETESEVSLSVGGTQYIQYSSGS